MNKKNRSIIRAIIITLSVFAVIIVSLSFCLMKHLMGVSKEKTEAEARVFHNIDDSFEGEELCEYGETDSLKDAKTSVLKALERVYSTEI